MRKLKLLAALAAVGAVGTGVALAAASPSVSTRPATHVTERSADLRGVVNPNGQRTYYSFQWGLTSSYGYTTKTRGAGSGKKPVDVFTTIQGLLPGTTYHYRIGAISKSGASVGHDRTLETTGAPPAGASTGPATNVSANSVTLTGQVVTNGVATSYHFVYTPAGGTPLQTVPQKIPAGQKLPVSVSYPLSGLQAGTMYSVQLVATNRGVNSTGATVQFMTFPNPAPHPQVTATTKPRHARHRPFVLNTTGRVLGPSSIPAQYGCTGTVRVRFWRGRHKVAETFTPLNPDCTFSAQTVFNRLPGRHHGRHETLRVFARFGGNGYLTAAVSNRGKVKLG